MNHKMELNDEELSNVTGGVTKANTIKKNQGVGVTNTKQVNVGVLSTFRQGIASLFAKNSNKGVTSNNEFTQGLENQVRFENAKKVGSLANNENDSDWKK